MKEKEPKIASFRNATTIYMGHANGQDGEWDLFYSVHFEDRSAERKCSVEKASLTTMLRSGSVFRFWTW